MENNTLRAIALYVADHIQTSNESWSFKGLADKDFSVKALLQLIYYIDTDLFDRIKDQCRTQGFFNSLKDYAECKVQEDNNE